MRKPNIGDELFLVHNVRPHVQQTYKVTVTKVGRKYFYVELYGWEYPFKLDTWRYHTDFDRWQYVLYENQQDYLDEVELENLKDSFRKAFAFGSNKKITLNQARRIGAILEEKD